MTDAVESTEFVIEDELFTEAKCPKCKKVAPPWMTTFADMATLLMALFSLMYNFAEMDEREKAQALGSINATFGASVIIPVIDIPVADSIIFTDYDNCLLYTSDAADE